MCVVCQCGFSDGDMLGVLPCGHRFHQDCIAQGLRYSPLCPTCKHDSTDPNPTNLFRKD